MHTDIHVLEMQHRTQPYWGATFFPPLFPPTMATVDTLTDTMDKHDDDKHDDDKHGAHGVHVAGRREVKMDGTLEDVVSSLAFFIDKPHVAQWACRVFMDHASIDGSAYVC